MTIKTIIETELDKIHGKDTYFIDTDREEVEKTIDRIISTLLDEIEEDVQSEFDGFLLLDWSGEAEVYAEIERLKNQVLPTLNKYRV